MIVNLYVDHLASTPPSSAEEVWAQTQEHPKVYAAAASKIGLTPREYTEFKRRLLDGDAVYTKLPRRVDAMAGDHRGSIYAVRNAQMTSTVTGWKVTLGDGKIVYVPQTCGNLSVVAAAPRTFTTRYTPSYHPVYAPTATIPIQSVAVAPPADVPLSSSDVPASPASVPAMPQAPASNYSGLLALPVIGGIIYVATHHDEPPAPPPCSQGSNAEFACRK
jgi:hypothetical protein